MQRDRPKISREGAAGNMWKKIIQAPINIDSLDSKQFEANYQN